MTALSDFVIYYTKTSRERSQNLFALAQTQQAQPDATQDSSGNFVLQMQDMPKQ